MGKRHTHDMCNTRIYLADFQKELLDNAKNNWCKSQVDMLEALIASTCTGVDYADVFDKLKESEAE